MYSIHLEWYSNYRDFTVCTYASKYSENSIIQHLMGLEKEESDYEVVGLPSEN